MEEHQVGGGAFILLSFVTEKVYTWKADEASNVQR